jgi:hypothetical protein
MTAETITQYLLEHVPGDWFEGTPAVTADEDEVLCVGTLPATGPTIDDFRASTREGRMAIAAEAESRFGRKVSWGVVRDGETTLFTSLSLPVMTRLRIRERAVLDTLVRGGVARSRSDALAWCVRLVDRHQGAWLGELREALADVDAVRRDGPAVV